MGMSFSLRVLVVDDEPLIRGLLKDALVHLGYTVETAGSARWAKRLAMTFDPDIALLDIDLGTGPNGLDLELALRKLNPEMAIVFLTNLPSPKLVGRHDRSIPQDAAYVLKSRISNTAVLDETIRLASKGRGSSVRDDLAPESQFPDLSPSQMEVLKLVSVGMSNADIAKQRGTSERAVRMLVARAFRAVGIEGTRGANRVQAALKFLTSTSLP